MATVSVISRRSPDAANPEVFSTCSTDSTSESCANALAETLTLIVKASINIPVRSHSRPCRHDSHSTHSSICAIQPHFLGDAEKLVRHEQPAFGMLPAYQRLDAHDVVIRQRTRSAGTTRGARDV